MVEWWLYMIEDHWSQSHDLPLNVPEEEQNKVCPQTSLFIKTPLIPIDGYSSFNHLKRNTTWIFWFVWNSLPSWGNDRLTSHLSGPDYQWLRLTGRYFPNMRFLVRRLKFWRNKRRYLNLVCCYPTFHPWWSWIAESRWHRQHQDILMLDKILPLMLPVLYQPLPGIYVYVSAGTHYYMLS